MEQSTPDEAATAISSADVVAALMRVLDGTQFTRSPRAREFLAYVVAETLAGRGGNLSERTIARRALDRGADFDSKEDASVRVQASRVRKYLEDYYATEGRTDCLRLRLPRGSYVVEFERSAPRPRDAATVPGVVVAMLTSSGDEPAGLVARSLTESLVQHLAVHSHIRVIGPIDTSGDASAAADVGGVASILTGHVSVRDGRLSLVVRLVDAQSQEVLWSDEEVVDRAALAGFEVEEMWSREIAAKVGDPSGLVIRQELARGRSARSEPELAARLAFYAYLNVGSPDSISAAATLLDAALEAGSRTAPLLAMRAALANTASVYDVDNRDAELDLAEALAREALTQDGNNVHAQLVLCWPLLQRGHVVVAVEIAENAARLVTYHPTYLSTAGTVLIACGEWQRGSALIREALRLHPGLSAQMYSWLAMAHLAEGNYERALAEATLLPSDGGFVWGPLFRAMALAGLGYREQSQLEVERVREMRPDVTDDLAAHLSDLVRLTPEQLTRLVGLVQVPRVVVPLPRRESAADSPESSVGRTHS